MKDQLKDVAEIVKDLPDGEYKGVWSGYQIRFKIGDREYMGKSPKVGLRGTSKCIVTIKDGNITAETVS